MKRIKWAVMLSIACLISLMSSTPAMADAITNPSFTGLASEVGTGFNIGLGAIAVPVGVALLCWVLFKRAAKK